VIRQKGLLLVGAGVLAFGACLAGAPQDRGATLDAWRAAIESHAPGRQDSAVTLVARWSRSDLEGVLEQLERTVAVSDQARLLRRAIVLHTDLLVLLRGPSGYDLPADEDRSVGLVADAIQMGVRRGTVQWEFVRRLVDRLHEATSDRAEADEFVRLWYRATAAFLESWEDWPESDAHLAAAKRLLGEDPVLLLYEGTIHEAYAGPAIQSLEAPKELRPPEPVRFATGSIFSVPNLQRAAAKAVWVFQSADVETQEAARLFRQAIAKDPRLAEARVRLGHVLGMRGRPGEAAGELQQGIDLAASPLLRYWGLVFLGREQRRLGNDREAADAFARASALYPDAQSPRIGLSQIAYDRGDRDGALRDFQAIFTARTDRDFGDPRLVYGHTHVPGADAWLAELRTSFLR
jgi:tetratricopeptide (TPR) repeat protein